MLFTIMTFQFGKTDLFQFKSVLNTLTLMNLKMLSEIRFIFSDIHFEVQKCVKLRLGYDSSKECHVSV